MRTVDTHPTPGMGSGAPARRPGLATAWVLVGCVGLALSGAGAAGTRTYTASRGDSLSRIAQRHGVTVGELCRANGITDVSRVSAGQRLVIPAALAPNAPAASVEVADGYPDGWFKEKGSKAAPKAKPAANRSRVSPSRSGAARTAKPVSAPKPGAQAPRAAQPTRAQTPNGSAAGTGAQLPRPASAPGATAAGTQRSAPDAVASGPGLPPKRISVNFSDVDVRQALTTIASYAGVDILVTPGTKGTVSVNVRDRTPDESVRLVAASAGLAVAKIGESYIVGPGEEVRQASAELGTTEVVTLQHAKPEQARDALSRVAPRVVVATGGKSVSLSGSPEDVATARQALAALDVPPPAAPEAKPETNVCLVQHADPENLEKTLRVAFPAVKMTRLERMFTLTGTPSDLQAAQKAMATLDVAQADSTRAVAPESETLVYRLQFLNAQRAEETLKKLFPTMTVAAGPEATAPPAASFQPLSLNILGGGGASGGSFVGTGTTSGASGYGGLGGGAAGTAQGQPLSRSTQLILMGTPAQVAAARAVLQQTDVAAPLVRIEAAVIEANRSDLTDLGVRWDFSDTVLDMTVPGGNGLHFGDIQFSDLPFRAALDALVTKGRARILASPNITVMDNEDASIFIGDLIRYRGINVVSPDVGTVQGTETIPVGIALLVRPRIHPDQGVTLKVHPVVSSVSAIVDGLPQTASREADTTVRLARGEQLVIGGLDRTETIREERRVPILGDIPVIGELFRSRTRRETTTQIIIVIRAYPADAAPAPPAGQRFTVPPTEEPTERP